MAAAAERVFDPDHVTCVDLDGDDRVLSVFTTETDPARLALPGEPGETSPACAMFPDGEEVLLVADIARDDRLDLENRARLGSGALVGVRVSRITGRRGPRANGIILVTWDAPRPLGDREAELAHALATLSVPPLASARMWDATETILRELRGSEERHRSIVETAVDAIITIDAHGTIQSVNPAVTRLFHYTPDELIGQNVRMLMDGDDRAHHDHHLARYAATGDAHIIGIGRLVEGRRKDGAHIPLHLSVGEMQVDGHTMYTGVLRDISDRVAAEERLEREMARTREMAREQSVLRAVAEAVAGEPDLDNLFRVVTAQTTGLLEARDATLLGSDGSGAMVLARTGPDGGPLTGGDPVDADELLAQLAVASAPVRSTTAVSGVTEFMIGAPVRALGRTWGGLWVRRPAEDFTDDDERRIAHLADLVGVAVSNSQIRALLAERAERDPLTGLTNHGELHARLHREVTAARRDGREASLILFDIDHFKRVNDTFGHPVGDEILREVANRLRTVTRPGDHLGRVGGEEFALLLIDCDEDEAVSVAERAREAVRETPMNPVGRVTLSCGVCALTEAEDAPSLYRHADDALLWVKRNGRDGVARFTPGIGEASGTAVQDGVATLRRQAIRGIRALARAVDAKDPATRRHSDRVAVLSVRLATVLGWSPERLAELHDAALIHDVGKIGVPDAVLLKPGRLTGDEYEAIKMHAALGAVIAREVLESEQVRWVRHHHERWDGRGYPDGVAGDQIPQGARIIAVADAFDVMTSARIYAAPRTVDEALAECRTQAARQFCPEVVAALEELARSGALEADI